MDNQAKENVEVDAKYLKEDAMKANYVRETQFLNAKISTELLPEMHQIPVNRTFQTKDPVILNYWYKLANQGKFGDRIAHLISLDAYGKIPQTSETASLSTDDKVDQIASTLTTLTNALMRTQKLTENNMSSQAKALHYIQKVAGSVKSHGAILDVIKAVLTSETDYSPEDIKEVLNGIEDAFNKVSKQQ